jgi:hypothetical protein
MNYFNSLPTISYEINGTPTQMKNLFYYLNISSITDEILTIYRINGTKRLDQISYELYNTTDYWWILALINEIQDIIFDLPVTDEILRDITSSLVAEKFTNIVTVEALDYYDIKLDELTIDNDSKRIIKIIDKSYIGRVISEINKSL